MKLKRVTRQDGSFYGFLVKCPGCAAFFKANGKDWADSEHLVPVKPDPKGWEWNGSETAPTFTPSLLVHETKAGPNATLVPPGTILQPQCHSFIVDGRWQFLADCKHPLAGQTVDMLDIDSV